MTEMLFGMNNKMIEQRKKRRKNIKSLQTIVVCRGGSDGSDSSTLNDHKK